MGFYLTFLEIDQKDLAEIMTEVTEETVWIKETIIGCNYN